MLLCPQIVCPVALQAEVQALRLKLAWTQPFSDNKSLFEVDMSNNEELFNITVAHAPKPASKWDGVEPPDTSVYHDPSAFAEFINAHLQHKKPGPEREEEFKSLLEHLRRDLANPGHTLKVSQDVKLYSISG